MIGMSPEVSIVMSTYNGAHTLPRVLSAYEGQPGLCESAQILIVDNASTDDTGRILRRFAERLPIQILYEKRQGKAFGLNHALDYVKGDLVIFTDDDAIPMDGWYQAMRSVSEQNPQASVFGGAIEPLWEASPPGWIQAIPLGVTYGLTAPDLAEGPVSPGLIWGANMAVRRQVIDEGYRFDKARGPKSGRYVMGVETEFTTRVANWGFKCWFTPTARVQHIIRSYQMDKPWVVARGFKYGRDIYLKKRCEYEERFLTIFGCPQWFFSQYARLWFQRLKVMLERQETEDIAIRWELGFLEGQIYQAFLSWRSRKS